MPASPAKIEANRRNAQKSTGPRTIAGKNRSRFNALKHGWYAETWNRVLARYLGIGLTEDSFGWNWSTHHTALLELERPSPNPPESSVREQAGM